jgi:hypothetical protein
MLIRQLSVFVPNQKGHLARFTGLLKDHAIDIRALVCFDTAEYGILRAIVSDPERAVEILTEEGFVAKISQVLAVEPEDRTGSLHEIFRLIADAGQNVDYMYSFVPTQGAMPYFVIKTDDIEKTGPLLKAAGVKVIDLEL